MSRIRRMVLATLFVSALVPHAAFACVCRQITDAERFKEADAVFLARVVGTRQFHDAAYPKERALVEATYETLEIFKGKPGKGGKLIGDAYTPINCALPLLAGVDYIFFLTKNSWVSTCDKSRAFFGVPMGEPSVLDEIRRLGKAQ